MSDVSLPQPATHRSAPSDDGAARLMEEVRRALSTPGLSAEQTAAIVRLAQEAAHAIRRERADDERRRLTELVDFQEQMIGRLRATIDRRARVLDGALWAARAGLWECRLRDEKLDWSAGVYDLFGYPNGKRLHRQDTLDCYAPLSLATLEKVRGEAIRSGGRFGLDAEITTAKGDRRWIRLSGVVERERGVPVRLYGLKQDVTEERAVADETRRLAEVDVLTGLPNRRLFDERLGEMAREPDAALLLIDLDGFKQINDTFGHALGDACLQEAAKRLKSACRTATLVARIGGDEFAALLPDARSGDRIARRIVEALRMSVERDGVRLGLGASVGLAPSEATTAREWFSRADVALYAAKASGRDSWRRFDPSMAAPAVGLRQAG